MMTNNSESNPSFHVPFPPSNPNLTFPTFPLQLDLSVSNRNPNPKKKRTKIFKNDTATSSSASPKPTSIRPKYTKKPDPSAPKITRPCTECGKQFWSWKALFGHMRCHPEREWRGINPPPKYRRAASPLTIEDQLNDGWVSVMSEDDREVASCLLMLANSVGPSGSTAESGGFSFHPRENDSSSSPLSSTGLGYRFECGGCKKVFGSHQALGGHRASHKNVKGCFAITKSCDFFHEANYESTSGGAGDGTRRETGTMEDQNKSTVTYSGHHRCSICYRVFTSGQALGGHMRCHWEREEEPQEPTHVGPTSCNFMAALDLNLPANPDDSSSDTSGFSLDLKLGL